MPPPESTAYWYYKPSAKRERSAQNQNGGVLAEICDHHDESRLLSHDPTLTAFAQLGAFRPNCERSFISLMVHNNQYILAEATRNVSLDAWDKTDPGDEVYLGPRVLHSVCPNTVQVFTAKGTKNFSTPYVQAT